VLFGCQDDGAEEPITLGIPDGTFEEDVVALLDDQLSRSQVLTLALQVETIDGVRQVQSQLDPARDPG
jgi:hypothetical protein